MIASARQLDESIAAQQCSDPDCKDCKKPGVRSMSGKCHPNGGVDVLYLRGTGVLNVQCHVCKKHIVNIQIALEKESAGKENDA
jgi:hypothetical protein